ncbi:adenylate kinase 8 [Pelobates cultripes]|uniref:Adenylate kinase 8 n=1 Tax=Pelobates cultripes TaxID=61616 RepID=A0AAD1T556_PELCU|nr:adenylate kinase 8 [Pelobates cultripes]
MDATAKPLRIPPEMAVYAEEHKVFDIIQKMVERLLVDRPENTIQYLIDHLRNDNDEVPRIFVLGPPASGKHTMAKLLCKRLNATHITLENLLSNDVSALVKEAHSYKDKGQDIANELWAKLIQERLSKVDCVKRGWILEGFPRTREQALLLQMNGNIPDHVVVLDAPDIVLIERNMGKRIDRRNGEIYHTTFDWPDDPEIQDNLVEPEGISEEETGQALLVYHRHIPGILCTYLKVHKKINADQPCMDVFSQVLTFVLSKPRSVAPYTPRVLLYGPPGSGRGLQASLLSQKYGLVNICCGQLLKEAVANESKYEELIGPYIENSQQAPNNIVLKILLERLSRLDSAMNGWVLHGFPRDTEQASLLNDAGFMPNRVFFLDIPDFTAIERLSYRMTDPVSGERYHSIYKPAPGVDVHQRLQQNPKDSEDQVQARLEMYHANAEDLEEFYQDVIHVNADQDPYTVFEFIESCIIKPLPKSVPGDPASP